MDTKERRVQISQLLQMDLKPVSATTLADRFGVSRQIIVGDIALLRASGVNVVATSRGYILNKPTQDSDEELDSYVIVCRHDKGALEQELYTVVDNGGSLLNITVEHPFYGNIIQPLNICSRYDADNFLNKVAVSGGSMLSSLTGNVHMHTLRCPNAESYRRILTALKDHGILYIKS